MFAIITLGCHCPSDMWGWQLIYTPIGLRHPEMALPAAFRTGSIFEACYDRINSNETDIKSDYINCYGRDTSAEQRKANRRLITIRRQAIYGCHLADGDEF